VDAVECLAEVNEILQHYGLTTKIVTVIQKLYEKSSSAVRVNGDTSSWFQVETGVCQGCILSPLLFAIAIDWVLGPRTTVLEGSSGLKTSHCVT